MFMSDWEYIGLNVSVMEVRGYGFSFPKVDVTLKRRTVYYIVCMILPMVMTCYTNSVVFLLPLSNGEKISFLVTIYVSTSVFGG